MVDALRAELVGPETLGEPLAIDGDVTFATWGDANGPWFEEQTGEEILSRDGPTKRYGVAVLYPPDTPSADESADTEDHDEDGESTAELDPSELGDVAPSPSQIEAIGHGGGGSDPDDFDLTAANRYRPSAIAVSFVAQVPAGSRLRARVECGRYETFAVMIEGVTRHWWVRRPVFLEASWDANSLLEPTGPHAVEGEEAYAEGLGDIDVRFEAFSRPREEGRSLVTIALVNRSEGSSSSDLSLFQVEFDVECEGDAVILPYPDSRSPELLEHDDEERSLALLYRNTPTFGVGHGCAAIWDSNWGDQTVEGVRASALPEVDTPAITPGVLLPNGSELEVSMAALGGLDPERDGIEACRLVIDSYRSWISERRAEIDKLEETHRPAAGEHLDACERVAKRMDDGLLWLTTDATAARAFALANQAVLEQQLRSGLDTRTTTITAVPGQMVVDGQHPQPEWRTSIGRGNWRPFQVGFLLAAARSSVLTDDDHRQEVELIFFPTGGGKTEAYLGLAAFTLFYQRLSDQEHSGVGVLMRYTLRLLTAQQFLRASALICAMELIRQNEEDLGSKRFSIGIWVGMSATPNRCKDARSALSALNKRSYEKNPFLVLQCPWCGAAMGPASAESEVRRPSGLPTTAARVAGYIEREGCVRFRCPDSKCQFSTSDNEIPVHVVDEDVYRVTPSIVIGTIDKFAQVAWITESRRLFGIKDDGSRGWSPPTLIIQDELHLISGPLGSMAGLYETLVEDLCTDHRTEPPRVPKVVCSTATIRHFRKQIKGLYNRDRVTLFPPLGLDASDSFFASYAKDDQGMPLPGKKYVGVYAPGLGSMQTTQVRTMSALLQSASELDRATADPWWTLMCFFNSLRELGTSVSLLQSDIPDYLIAMRNRRGTAPDDIRYLNVVKELTARLREDEVPRAIQELSRSTSDSWPVDICLASSMIEVGIDITRLSLMAVVGQPKSTSQYIQVTGRIGRQWWKSPGLVVTIYGASKPRDRSHFERFKPYHDKLYAQVEPVSVTPFAPPVVRRAAHAILCGYVRQTGPESIQPWPVPEALVDKARRLLEERSQEIDQDEYPELKELLGQRLREWRSWERQDWDAKATSGLESAPLLRAPGRWYPDRVQRVSWATPTSMRDVDAECQGEITLHYIDPPVET